MDAEQLKEFFRDFDTSEWAGSDAAKCADLCAAYYVEMGEDGHEASYAREGFLMGFIWCNLVYFALANQLTTKQD